MEAAQYESLGRADDALLVKMLQAGLQKLKAGNHGEPECLPCLRSQRSQLMSTCFQAAQYITLINRRTRRDCWHVVSMLALRLLATHAQSSAGPATSCAMR